jgi:hypothetical protein
MGDGSRRQVTHRRSWDVRCYSTADGQGQFAKHHVEISQGQRAPFVRYADNHPQRVTDEFIKLRADPDTTAAQWHAFRDHHQASKYANSMKNFYEVCTLKLMPEVENVDITGAADDQIRPAWEQAAPRRMLKVEPVVIPGAAHADTVIT